MVNIVVNTWGGNSYEGEVDSEQEALRIIERWQTGKYGADEVLVLRSPHIDFTIRSFVKWVDIVGIELVVYDQAVTECGPIEEPIAPVRE